MLLMVTVSLLLPVNSNPVVVVEGGTVTTGELGMIDQDQDMMDREEVSLKTIIELFFHYLCWNCSSTTSASGCCSSPTTPLSKKTSSRRTAETGTGYTD